MERLKKHNLPGRNEQCPCQSGRKFKKCCLPAAQEYVSMTDAERQDKLLYAIFGDNGKIDQLVSRETYQNIMSDEDKVITPKYDMV